LGRESDGTVLGEWVVDSGIYAGEIETSTTVYTKNIIRAVDYAGFEQRNGTRVGGAGRRAANQPKSHQQDGNPHHVSYCFH